MFGVVKLLTDGIDIVNSTDEEISKHGEPAIRKQHRNGEEMSDCQRDQATSGAPWGWIFSFVETRQRDHHKTPKWATDCHVDISLTGSPFSRPGLTGKPQTQYILYGVLSTITWPTYRHSMSNRLCRTNMAVFSHPVRNLGLGTFLRQHHESVLET